MRAFAPPNAMYMKYTDPETTEGNATRQKMSSKNVNGKISSFMPSYQEDHNQIMVIDTKCIDIRSETYFLAQIVAQLVLVPSTWRQ